MASNPKKRRTPALSRKSQEASKPQVGQEQSKAYALPTEVQQCVLNVFKIAFPIVDDLDALKTTVQEVKGHLFNRDFAAAFGQQSYLQAYAVRWSAARALGYSALFAHSARRTWFEQAQTNSELREQLAAGTTQDATPVRVVCIGGGAGAELVSLAAAAASQASDRRRPLHITAIDSADWRDVIESLTRALFQKPAVPAYVSSAARERIDYNALLSNETDVKLTFRQQDVLSWPDSELREDLRNSDICTIMFTLNELFTSSMAKATSFLLKLTDAMPAASRFVVVDSPGSYSEIKLGKDGTSKKYPMKWLLDHTLLDVAGKDENLRWEKEEDHDSVWFRLDQSKLNYPVDLENMRYQIHVYRRI